MHINFTIATEKNIPEILDMMEAFNAIDHYPFRRDKTRKNLMEFLANPSLGRLWLINHDNLTVGYIVLAYGYSFEHDGKDAFIDELFIKADYRNKGIGKLAMDYIQTASQKLGVKVIHLEVEPNNKNGLKLYKEKGYTDNGRYLLSKKVNTD